MVVEFENGDKAGFHFLANGVGRVYLLGSFACYEHRFTLLKMPLHSKVVNLADLMHFNVLTWVVM